MTYPKNTTQLDIGKNKGNRIYNLSSWLKFLLLNIPKIFKNFDFFLVNISSFNYFSKK